MADREPIDSSDGGRLRRLEALDELLPTLTGVLDIREVFVRISTIAQRVLPHDFLGLPLMTEDDRHVEIFAITGVGTIQRPDRVLVPEPLRRLLYEPWDHMLIEDALADPVERDLPPARAGCRSALRLPLRLSGRFLGVLDFYSLTPGFYRESDVIIGRKIADHVVLALSHYRLSQANERAAALQERAATLELLDGLLNALTGVLSLREAFDEVSDVAQKVLSHDATAIMIPTEDPSRAHMYAVRGFGDVPATIETRVRDPELLTTPWDHRLIDDLSADAIYRDTISVKIGMQSALLLPVRFDGRLQAIVSFTSRQKAHFHKDHVLIGRRIADHIALALSHERRAEQQRRSEVLRTQTANLELLDELLATLTDTGELQTVFDRLSAVSDKVLPHDAVICGFAQRGSPWARVYVSSGLGDRPFPERVQVPDSIRANPSWQYDIVEDLRTCTDQVNVLGAERGYRSVMRVPIFIDATWKASLAFYSRTVARYSPADVMIARRIADRLAISLARERQAEVAKRADEANERAARLEARVRALSDELDARTGYRRVIGQSAPWRQVLVQATQVAATDTTVLLLGESGTGKEVVARFISRASTRKDGPFMALNCAALPDHLLEAELFGFERGAFTGAVQSKPGQLEQASGGTLFLDEVGEMSLPAQAKFLRVLQEREFQRLGGTRVLRTDARIVAATNRDLHKAIGQSLFREDLFYRLNVFAIQLPPLRDRRDDILPLSEAFLNEYGRGLGRPPAGISRDARQRLVDYHWPGNVRELRNILERAAILCEGGLITTEHLAITVAAGGARPPVAPIRFAGPDELSAGSRPAQPCAPEASAPPAGELAAMERSMIEQALQNARFNKSKAAKELGLSRAQLYVRMRRYGLE